jgi:inner membrane protein involved in colicin E2 resistance
MTDLVSGGQEAKMGKHIVAIVLIFLFVVVAWAALGSSIHVRTWETDRQLHGAVANLWGSPQQQTSPELTFKWQVRKTVKEKVEDAETRETRIVTRERLVWEERPMILDSSDIEVDLELDQRKKGLLWYATYQVAFDGSYSYTHEDDREGILEIVYRFPALGASYDDFRFEVDGELDPKMTPVTDNGVRIVRERVPVRRGATVPFRVSYRSRGLDSWHYAFGPDVSRVKNFTMVMKTDFREIDFPRGTISPSSKREAGNGWRLEWASTNLISGFRIGMEMPRRLNPGPLAARISFFAPVCLGFFFAWIFVITLLEGVRLHPMNYLFLAAAFFSFHLLFSYTVDHIALVPAFVLASAVSVFLVVSYLRLVVGLRFAAVEAGISQLVYLVLFSYAHFLEGFTGLIVTVGSILTLFALMQLTGRIDWTERFKRFTRSGPAKTAPEVG